MDGNMQHRRFASVKNPNVSYPGQEAVDDVWVSERQVIQYTPKVN